MYWGHGASNRRSARVVAYWPMLTHLKRCVIIRAPLCIASVATSSVASLGIKVSAPHHTRRHVPMANGYCHASFRQSGYTLHHTVDVWRSSYNLDSVLI